MLLLLLCMQADVALMPFFERFRLCLQLTQDSDIAGEQEGAVAAWLVSMNASHRPQHWTVP